MTQRILRATTGSLSWQPLDGDGEPGNQGTVTVGVTASDGSTVIAAGTATTGSTTDPRTIALTVAQSADLEVLTATWKVGTDVVAVTDHWVVGGFLFSAVELRAVEPSTADGSRDVTAAIQRARSEVEDLFENATGVPWTPRLHVVCSTRDHDGYHLATGSRFVRSVRWCRLWYGEDDYTELTAAELAQIVPAADGIVKLPMTTAGHWKVTAGVEVGYFVGTPIGVQIPADVRRAAFTYGRSLVHQARSAVPDRAMSMQTPDGTSVTLATAGLGRWRTAIPAVDEVLNRYDRRPIGYPI